MSKLKLRILNIIYLAFSGFALFWYSINFIKPDKVPFLNLGVNVELNEDNSAEIIDETISSMGISKEDLFAEGPINVEASIQIKNQMLYDVWKSDDPNAVVNDYFIDPNVDSLVEQIKPAFMKVAKSAAKGALKSNFENQLKNNLGNGEDLYTALANGNSDLTPERLSADVDAVFDALLAEDATIDSVSTLLAEKYTDYAVALGGEEKTSEQMKNEIESTFKEMGLVDEDGKINDIEDVIAKLLGGMLEDGGSDDSKSSEIALRKLLNPNYNEEEAAEESPIAEKLKAFLNEQLDADTRNIITIGFRILGIALAAFMLGWAIRLVQVLLTFFMKRPYIITDIVGIITGIVQFLLALISVVVMIAFQFNGIEFAKSIPGLSSIISTVPFIKDGTGTASIMFSAMIPGLMCLAIFILSFFYKSAKKKYKAENGK